MSKKAEEYNKEFDSMYGNHTPDLPASKAKQAALEAYPVDMVSGPIGLEEPKFDFNSLFRYIFIEGYEQAEKDIISIIESRISEILGDAQPNPVLRTELQELIKRIKR